MNSSIPTTNNALAKLASEGYVSLRQFALIIGVSYPTAQKLAREEKVEVIKVGGINRIYATEVNRYLREGNKEQNEGRNTPHSS